MSGDAPTPDESEESGDGDDRDPAGGDDAADDLDAVAAAVDERLAATAELPVDPAASTRLGEAAAVARDLVRGPPADSAVTRERLAVVADLLAEVDGTGSPAADEHVAAARERLSRALDPDPDGSDASVGSGEPDGSTDADADADADRG